MLLECLIQTESHSESEMMTLVFEFSFHKKKNFQVGIRPDYSEIIWDILSENSFAIVPIAMTNLFVLFIRQTLSKQNEPGIPKCIPQILILSFALELTETTLMSKGGVILKLKRILWRQKQGPK